jgi:ABC-type nitrate/sulfonate/bicarbonate transport system permease component
MSDRDRVLASRILLGYLLAFTLGVLVGVWLA